MVKPKQDQHRGLELARFSRVMRQAPLSRGETVKVIVRVGH